MIDNGKHNILGVSISAVDYETVIERLIGCAKKEQRCAVTALAVHGVMTGVFDSTHRHRLNQFELVVPDGQPVRWALNQLYGTALTDRVYGPRLMLEACRRAAEEQLPIFLLGGNEDLLASLTDALRSKFPSLVIAGTRASRFRQLNQSEKSDLVSEIKQSGARMTFVGLGCPRQEVFVYEFSDQLSMPMMAVGAAFAFHAGRLPQAPAWMQDRGLEWLYRFSCEPIRLWKRYVLLNPAYLLMLGLQAVGIFQPNLNDTTEPAEELLYG